ncbi:MAG TPA: cohesin domain-containing protein, partial [Blastocatellia bacterium]|nr:cohesin domain-containing protein [Blastocatellia bacterium]
QPVAPARVVASRRPENIERLAQEGLKQKEQEADKGKPELRAEVPPETARAATGSQQPVAPAAVKSPARDPRVTLNLAPAPAMPQVGKEVTLTLAFEGRAPLAGGQLSLSFDPGKLKLKAVRDGGLLGEGAEVGHQVSGGTLTLTLKPGAGAERTSGALVVVEFVALAEGQTTVKLDSDASQLRLAGNLAAQLTATAAQFQIAK